MNNLALFFLAIGLLFSHFAREHEHERIMQKIDVECSSKGAKQ